MKVTMYEIEVHVEELRFVVAFLLFLPPRMSAVAARFPQSQHIVVYISD
jgi:hypothetical protein